MNVKPVSSWSARAVVAALALLPFRVSATIAAAMAWLVWKLQLPSAFVAHRNVTLLFPELPAKQQEAMAQDILRHASRTLWETPRVWRLGESAPDMSLSIEGFDCVQQAQAEGAGVLAIVPHQGNWEMLHAWVAAHLRLTLLYRAPRQRWLHGLLYEQRGRFPSRQVAATSSGVRHLIRALRKGEVIGILPDQAPPRGAGIYASFFGISALTTPLPVKLVQKTGCAVVTAVCERTAIPGEFHLRFARVDTETWQSDTEQAVHAMNRLIEETVAEQMTQYQWTYARFKRPPQGQPNPYQD